MGQSVVVVEVPVLSLHLDAGTAVGWGEELRHSACAPCGWNVYLVAISMYE